jgi:hypothetical protein
VFHGIFLVCFSFSLQGFSYRFIVTLPSALKYTLGVQQLGDLGFGLFDQLEPLQPSLIQVYFLEDVVDSSRS